MSKHYTRAILFCCSLLFAGFTSRAQTGWDWGIKNTGKGGMQSSPSAVDAAGNLYVAGSTYGTAFTIDSMVFGAHVVPGSGHVDQLIITKVDTGGHYVWAIGSQGASAGVAALTVGASGDIFIVGWYSDTTFTLGTVTITNPVPAYSMLFIARISSSGTALWAENVMSNMGGSDPSDFGIGADAAGNIYVTGNFYQFAVTFGSTTLANHGPSYTSDILLLKYNSAGVLRWARSFGGNYVDLPFIQGNYAGFDATNNIMSVTPAGNIYLTGLFFSDSITIGSTTLYNPYGGTSSPGPTYSYICKWDSSGNAMWAKYVNKRMQVNEIVSNANEEIFLAGNIDSVDTWGSFAMTPGALIAKMDSAGNLQWVVTDSGGDALTIGVDAIGNVLVAGAMSDSMSIGGHMLYAPAVHGVPMFAAEYTSSGAYVNSVSIADGGILGAAIRPDNFGKFYLVGNFFLAPLALGPDMLDTTGIESETTFIARYGYIAPTTTAVPQRAANTDDLLLYPNPAGNVLTIKAKQKMYAIEITDVAGRNLLSAGCDNELLQVDVSNIPAGIYLVKVNNTIVRKFVKE